MLLQRLKRLLDEVAQVDLAALSEVDLVAHVLVLVLEDVQHWQNLPVVRHERLADRLRTHDELLHDLERDGDNVGVARVQRSCALGRARTFDGDDELRDDGQNLGAAVLEQVEGALQGEEAVGLLLLSDAVEEERQVVVVVQVLDLDVFDPPEAAARARVLDDDGQVAAVVVAAEVALRDEAFASGACLWLVGERLLRLLVEAAGFGAATGAFFKGRYSFWNV